MNGVAGCRKLVAVVVVALSGSGVLFATSAAPGAAAAAGCAGTAYVTNEQGGTVSVINDRDRCGVGHAHRRGSGQGGDHP